MQLLEDRIRTDGQVLDGDVLKVGRFLNQQLDVNLLNEMGAEFARLFAGCGVNKIMTIEASGIGIACIAALHFRTADGNAVPVVFAKKRVTYNMSSNLLHSKAFSYTSKKENDIVMDRENLGPGDRILIIDDFLAKGSALTAMIDIAKQAGAHIVGAGIAIEKAYQGGGDIVRGLGVRLESLARITSMSVQDGIKFGAWCAEHPAKDN